MKSLYSLTLPIFFLCTQIWSMEVHYIPTDSWSYIFRFLEISDFKNFSLVSKKFNGLVNDEALWYMFAIRYFGDNANEFKEQDQTWKSALINRGLMIPGFFSQEELQYVISEEGFAKYEKHLLKNLQIKVANSIASIGSAEELAVMIACYLTYTVYPFNLALAVAKKAAISASWKAAGLDPMRPRYVLDEYWQEKDYSNRMADYNAAKANLAWKDRLRLAGLDPKRPRYVFDGYCWQEKDYYYPMGDNNAAQANLAWKDRLRLISMSICGAIKYRRDVSKLADRAFEQAALQAAKKLWPSSAVGVAVAANHYFGKAVISEKKNDFCPSKEIFVTWWNDHSEHLFRHRSHAENAVESGLNKLSFQNDNEIGDASWKLAVLYVLTLISTEGHTEYFLSTIDNISLDVRIMPREKILASYFYEEMMSILRGRVWLEKWVFGKHPTHDTYDW